MEAASVFGLAVNLIEKVLAVILSKKKKTISK